MIQETCPVKAVDQVAENIFTLTFISGRIAAATAPGQFVNVRSDGGIDPMLRRPFSVYFSERDEVQIIFHVIGRGTAALRRKRSGDTLDVLGPLGVPFELNADYDTAVLVGGGLGVAPLPMVTRELLRFGKTIRTFLGARSSAMVADQHLQNVSIATDDGSRGFHGNIVDLVKRELRSNGNGRIKMFGCGPTPMLRALSGFALEAGLRCEVSLEGPMGCGFGICQGCPVELMEGERKFALMCKDGPTFDVRRIRL